MHVDGIDIDLCGGLPFGVEVVLFAEKAVGVCAAWHEENTGRLVESVLGAVPPEKIDQALELVSRYLLKSGDTALVDDPGYYNLFGNLRLQGVEMLAVPRNPDGPDVAILDKMAAAHRPKVYFTQSVMQNPTGTDMSPHVAFKVLQAAERHNFTVVEDDIFCDLQMKTTPRLATFDQLDRVIYARSFSKTLSGSLRVAL